MKSYKYIDGAQQMNPTDFGEPLIFPVASPAGQFSWIMSNISTFT